MGCGEIFNHRSHSTSTLLQINAIQTGPGKMREINKGKKTKHKGSTVLKVKDPALKGPKNINQRRGHVPTNSNSEALLLKQRKSNYKGQTNQ